MTSKGNVVLLPYIRNVESRGIVGYSRTNIHTQERDFLRDGTTTFGLS